MDDKPNKMPNDAPQTHKPGPSGKRGKFYRGKNKKRKRNHTTAPTTTPTPNSTVSTTTSTSGTTGDTPLQTTQSKILFGHHEIEAIVTTDPSVADQWIVDTRAAHPADGKQTVVGLDCEWKPNRFRGKSNKVALLQLCIGNRCLILQLKYMGSVPDSVKAFLLDEMITFVGVGVGEDVAKLKGDYGLECTKSMDLQQACNVLLGLGAKICKGLKGYAREILGLEMQKSKNVTQSNWEELCLKESQIRYACLDAFVSYLLGYKVLEGKSD